MTDIVTVIGGLLSLIIGWLMISIRGAHHRIDRLERTSMSRNEISEKIDDKLDVIRIQHIELKEDLKEIKELCHKLANL